MDPKVSPPHVSSHLDVDAEETREWLESMEAVLKTEGPERAQFLLDQIKKLIPGGIDSGSIATPYRNTIPKSEEAPYPGDPDAERKIRGMVRWNALAMVLRANKYSEGLGGHLSSYASANILYEVGYNHFYRGRKGDKMGDQIFSQGHVSPGIYARAFVEGVLPESRLKNFRRELAEGGGVPSYPHPRLLPEFWQFPTVSMGLGPIMSMYLARLNKYLHARMLKDTTDSRVWAYLGDGELDEPETLGNLTFAVREQLDNLIWVVNCNLQRLDGPVRGNASVIQETEGVFRGAGWNVIKVVWGESWDPLFEKDTNGVMDQIFAKTVDGEYQRLAIASGTYNREHFFGKVPEGLDLVKDWSDEQIENLRRGGLDPKKVYAAYHRAENLKNGRPTVIIAKTIKGFGLGQSGESKNIAHQQKKMELEPLKALVKRYNLPLSEKDIEEYKFIRPEKGSPEMKYIEKIRERLGSFVPARTESAPPLALPGQSFYEPFHKATAGKGISTTMAFVRILSGLLSQKEMGKHVVPIIPDEARTFGMEGLFRQYGIYSVKGQLYDPVDSDSLTPYRESKDGQIFQEGINEAGSLASFIAAGTSYSHQGVNLVPFYSYYSMFGFQRVGDLIWAACDMKCRGFLMGGTSGRTTLNGEGLQHEDGHSPILASTFPNVQVYDPAFLYEMAVVIRDGLERMYQKGEDLFYYITMYNENYEHPAMPEGVEEGIKKGLYRFSKSKANAKHKIQLISSGVTFKDARKAAEILEKDHGVSVDLWSAPSFKRLREETQLAERWNKLHPTSKPKTSYLQDTLANEKGTFVAVTDYMRALPEMIAPWIPGGLYTLGTDGFGMSSSREELRRYFEVDTENIIIGCLHALALKGEIKMEVVAKAIKDLGVDPEKKHGLHLTTGKEH